MLDNTSHNMCLKCTNFLNLLTLLILIKSLLQRILGKALYRQLHFI